MESVGSCVVTRRRKLWFVLTAIAVAGVETKVFSQDDAAVVLWIIKYCFMGRSVYVTNRGVNAPIVFKGLQGQYIGYLGGGLVGLLVLFVVLYLVSMTDAERLAVINRAADAVEENYMDLREFTNENKVLSWQRAKDEKEVEMVKRMYGLEK